MAEGRGAETDRAAMLALRDFDAGGFEALGEITDFAAALCDASVALVSLIEEDRQRFLASTGVDAGQSPRSHAFCAQAMLGADLFVIPDATKDPRFSSDALVTGPSHIRFYAGAPLIDADGAPMGTLCVIGDEPRAGLTPLQTQGLTLLARQVATALAGRRRDLLLEARERRHAEEMADSDGRFRVLADAMPQMVWSTLPDGFHDYYNAQW